MSSARHSVRLAGAMLLAAATIGCTTTNSPVSPSPAASATGSGPSAGSQQPLSTAFDDLVEAARAEADNGTFVVWVSTPGEPDTHEALLDAFESRFDLPDIEYVWDASIPSGGRRLIDEAAAGIYEPDIVNGAAPTIRAQTEAGVIANVDYLEVFESELPAISDTYPSVAADQQGFWLSLYDQPRVVMFNSDQTTVDEVPDDIEGLLDPKWRGKIAVSANGTPYDVMSAFLSVDEILAHAQALVDTQEPIFASGSPAGREAVATGQATIHLGATLAAIVQLKEAGVPVDWKPLKYGLPMLSQYLAVTEHANNPNLARLFAAWITTEGQDVMLEHEGISRWGNPNALGQDRLDAEYPDLEPIFITSTEELLVAEEVRLQLVEIYTSGGAPS